MRTEVYSWRLSTDLKSQLEAEARARKVPVSRVLDAAVREWLGQQSSDGEDELEQKRLQAAALRVAGTITGIGSAHAARVREVVRERLQKKYGR